MGFCHERVMIMCASFNISNLFPKSKASGMGGGRGEGGTVSGTLVKKGSLEITIR